MPMLIKRKSPRTGKWNEMLVDVTPKQYEAWQMGTLIQHAMPDATATEREFIKTGLTQEDWDAIFKEDNEDMTFRAEQREGTQ